MALAIAAVAQEKERILWKRQPSALLRIDDRTVKLWEVYRAEKKGELVLVQLGRRFLLLNLQKKEIRELDETRLEYTRDGIRWSLDEEKDRVLPSAEWMVREVGAALRMRVQLAAEGRLLEVQLPVRPDLRSLY